MSVFNFTPACFYHPVQTLFLDDNQSFLDALELDLSHCLPMQTFTDPKAAFEAIQNLSQKSWQSMHHLIKNTTTDALPDQMTYVEISKLLNVIYDKERFSKIAVVVVDYEMPGINGIEFCAQLKDKSIFKIMLTAEADQETAIRAFNHGLIDQFIPKSHHNLLAELQGIILKLTQQYFGRMTKIIMDMCHYAIQPILNNEPYCQLVTKLMKERNLVEYYLVDFSGSLLFLDKNGLPTWLVVRHQNELAEQFELLQGYDVESSLLQSIAKKEKLLFFPSQAEYKQSMKDWHRFAFDASPLNHDYYFSLVNDPVTQSIRWNEVVPFAKKC